MRKILMEGVGRFALLEDADGAGYLAHDDAVAVQRERIDFGAFCEGLAAEYLHAYREAPLAKQALRENIRTIGRDTETGSFTEDEAELFDRFSMKIEGAIDKLASMNGLQRGFIRWMFRTPTFIKLLLVVGTLVTMAVVVGRILGK